MFVYFDNSATTKPYDEVIDATANAMKNFYANPSSLHKLGIECEKKLNESREILAKSINAMPEEILFTSGGTEGNNFVIKGIAKPGTHIITTSYEHSSVSKTLEELKNNDVKITELKPDINGAIDLEELEEAINKDTVLVSIMHVNNEIGKINDIKKISTIVKKISKRAKIHIDAVQSYGKFKINVKEYDIDFLTMSAHKIHGPKGVGFCYLKKGFKPNALISGGGQESGMRSGTENLPGIVGMAEAARISYERLDENYNKIFELKKYFIEQLSSIDDIRINSPLNEEFSPYILNVSFRKIRGEVLLHTLEGKDIFVSTGSACSSKSGGVKGSKVLTELGLSKCEIEGGIRFSFTAENTKEEVDYCIDNLKKSVSFLRRVSR